MEQKAQHEGERYLREVRRKILFLPRKSRKTLKELTSDVETYIADNPDCTYAALVDVFGPPDELPYSTIEKQEFDKLVRRAWIQRICVGLCVLLALVVIYFSLVLADIYKGQKNYVTFDYNKTTGEFDRIIGGGN